MSQSEDMAAINTYFQTTSPVSPQAGAIRDRFLSWYPTLSWLELHVNDGVYADARARRSAFNAANKTPEDPGGLTTEMMSLPPGQATQEKITKERKKNVALDANTKGFTQQTIALNSSGPAVVAWQRILGGIAADGQFGKKTEALTKNWQVAHNLKGDGVVGPKTWAVALSSTQKEAAEQKPTAPATIVEKIKEIVSPAPSSPSPKPSAQTPVNTTPKPAQKPKLAPAPTPRPATKPVPVPSKPPTIVEKVKEKAKETQIQTASFYSSIPLWSRVVLVVGAVIACFTVGAKTIKEYEEKHG